MKPQKSFFSICNGPHKLALACSVIFFFVSAAHAQKKIETTETTKKSPSTATSAVAKDKRRQTIDFEDELIQGDVNKPELFYLLQKKQFNFKRLIKLREDFLPEMRRTSEEVQRSGSKN